jgi:hypothetical protein
MALCFVTDEEIITTPTVALADVEEKTDTHRHD